MKCLSPPMILTLAAFGWFLALEWDGSSGACPEAAGSRDSELVADREEDECTRRQPSYL